MLLKMSCGRCVAGRFPILKSFCELTSGLGIFPAVAAATLVFGWCSRDFVADPKIYCLPNSDVTLVPRSHARWNP
jgi:hypothetical protein